MVGRRADVSTVPTTPPNLTAQGTILGTFQYMAPEQIEGHEADARTDIFAFGAVLYEMVTGKKAFTGKTTGEPDLLGSQRRRRDPSSSFGRWRPRCSTTSSAAASRKIPMSGGKARPISRTNCGGSMKAAQRRAWRRLLSSGANAAAVSPSVSRPCSRVSSSVSWRRRSLRGSEPVDPWNVHRGSRACSSASARPNTCKRLPQTEPSSKDVRAVRRWPGRRTGGRSSSAPCRAVGSSCTSALSISWLRHRFPAPTMRRVPSSHPTANGWDSGAAGR